MAADWERSGHDQDADTVTISETRVGNADRDEAYDVDPDEANYAAGNDPETAWRNQGSSDSPNGLSSYDPEAGNGHAQDDNADSDNETGDTQEAAGSGDPADMSGDTDPDDANYADLDGIPSPSERASPDDDQPAADHASGPDAAADHAGPDVPDADYVVTPEQARISALEAENGKAQQQITDANQQIADLKAEKDALAARLDRIEQLLAAPERQPDNPAVPEHTDGMSTSPPDQFKTPDAGIAKYSAEIAEHKGDEQGSDAKDDKHFGWRDVALSENVGIASAVVGAADTFAQFAMQATPEGVVTLGATVLGLTSLGLAKLEEKRKRKGKA